MRGYVCMCVEFPVALPTAVASEVLWCATTTTATVIIGFSSHSSRTVNIPTVSTRPVATLLPTLPCPALLYSNLLYFSLPNFTTIQLTLPASYLPALQLSRRCTFLPAVVLLFVALLLLLLLCSVRFWAHMRRDPFLCCC